jgi:predicted metal-dependent hydrolase
VVRGLVRPVRHYRDMATISIPGREVSYQLVRRPGMRTIRFTFTDDGLRVSCAPRVPVREIESALRERSGWLLRHAHLLDPAPAPPLVDGALLPLLDGEVELGLAISDRASWRFRDDDARLTVNAEAKEDVDRVLGAWYRAMATRFLGEMVLARAPQLGVPVPPLTIRDTRSRWGSCSSRGRVSLSWRLAMAPSAVADYVVVHELAHLREMNHSKAFWAVVASVAPDYKEPKAWLRRHGDELLQRRPRPG